MFTIEDKPAEEPKKDGSELFEPVKPADPVFITRPPFEEELLQSTLWPEIQKLYGHGNYTFCVTSSPSGDLLATAVRAKSDPEQATIRLWDTNTWKVFQLLTNSLSNHNICESRKWRIFVLTN